MIVEETSNNELYLVRNNRKWFLSKYYSKRRCVIHCGRLQIYLKPKYLGKKFKIKLEEIKDKKINKPLIHGN